MKNNQDSPFFGNIKYPKNSSKKNLQSFKNLEDVGFPSNSELISKMKSKDFIKKRKSAKPLKKTLKKKFSGNDIFLKKLKKMNKTMAVKNKKEKLKL